MICLVAGVWGPSPGGSRRLVHSPASFHPALNYTAQKLNPLTQHRLQRSPAALSSSLPRYLPSALSPSLLQSRSLGIIDRLVQILVSSSQGKDKKQNSDLYSPSPTSSPWPRPSKLSMRRFAPTRFSTISARHVRFHSLSSHPRHYRARTSPAPVNDRWQRVLSRAPAEKMNRRLLCGRARARTIYTRFARRKYMKEIADLKCALQISGGRLRISASPSPQSSTPRKILRCTSTPSVELQIFQDFHDVTDLPKH